MKPIFKAMDASTSALTAERLRMDVIANNLANMNTTRTPAGGPYRRRLVVETERAPSFQSVLAGQSAPGDAVGNGVQVSAVVEDQSPPQLKYDPTNPDADAQGFVRMPNVDMLTEITDMIISQRAYEANVTAFNTSKALAQKALEIGK